MSLPDLGRVAGRRAVVLLVMAIASGAGLAPAAAQDHPTQYSAADIAVGQRVYGTVCVTCHGPTGTGVSGVDLRRGPIRRAPTDDALRALIVSGIPTSGMPSFRLEPAEVNGLVAFIRAGFESAPAVPVALGDPARGRAIVEGRGECLSCHRLDERGTFAGPELAEIARQRTPTAMLAALLDPNPVMLPIHRPVRAVLPDGTAVNGRRLNEDLYTVQIVTTEGRLLSLVKSDLREWTVSPTSTMPKYGERLSAGEIADVVGFLASLKGGRP